MDAPHLVRTALISVWLLVGSAKLAAPTTTSNLIVQLLGFSKPLARISVLALSLFELLTAFYLATSLPVGAILSLALALGFAAISGVVATFTHEAPPCGCLGPRSTHPLGLRNLIAAGALAVGSLALLISPGVQTSALSSLIAATVLALACTLWLYRGPLIRSLQPS